MFKSVIIRDGHDNFFTPLRILFAILVVIGHSHVVKFRSDIEPILIYHFSYNYLAVNLFFIASGFLVTKSMLFRGDIAEFSSARLLRIYPALIVHVFFVMFFIGPLATSLPLTEFFAHKDFYMQPVWVLSFLIPEMNMPGIFENNAEQVGSIPLWTLRYEILAYMGTALAFSIGLFRHKWMVLAQFILPCIGWLLAKYTGVWDILPSTGQNILRFGIAYGLGAAIYTYKDRLSFNLFGLIICFALTALTHALYMGEIMMNITLAYFVFLVAYMRAPKLDWMKNLDDLSYGIYIYHWCILQTVYMYFPDMGISTLFLTSLALTALIAYTSWHLIEKPMLARKKLFAEKLRFGRCKPRYNKSDMLLD